MLLTLVAIGLVAVLLIAMSGRVRRRGKAADGSAPSTESAVGRGPDTTDHTDNTQRAHTNGAAPQKAQNGRGSAEPSNGDAESATARKTASVEVIKRLPEGEPIEVKAKGPDTGKPTAKQDEIVSDRLPKVRVPGTASPPGAPEPSGDEIPPVPAKQKPSKTETPLERAERLGDAPTLARFLIEAGEHDLAHDRLRAARTSLQRALEVCHKLRDPELEALARLNLGDLAERDGDLTSACEHWNLARSLFAGAGRHDAERAADDRMRRSQCPTDWVLNEF